MFYGYPAEPVAECCSVAHWLLRFLRIRRQVRMDGPDQFPNILHRIDLEIRKQLQCPRNPSALVRRVLIPRSTSVDSNSPYRLTTNPFSAQLAASESNFLTFSGSDRTARPRSFASLHGLVWSAIRAQTVAIARMRSFSSIPAAFFCSSSEISAFNEPSDSVNRAVGEAPSTTPR